MNLALTTFEQLLQMLRNPNLSAGAAEYIRAELRSRDRTLREQTRAIFAIGPL